MTAQVITTKTADGWDVHAVECKDVVVRTVGPRLTVATIADDDDVTPVPLAVTLGEPESVAA